MKEVSLIVGCLCLIFLAVSPAQAFTAKELTITIAPNGDAQVIMQYEFSIPESFAIFFRITDPAKELKNALETNLNKQVTVSRFDSTRAEVMIPSYASVQSSNGNTTLSTPGLSFEKAQDVLNRYWFAALVSPDFSPQITTVVFPDGYQAGFYDTISIPPLVHRITR